MEQNIKLRVGGTPIPFYDYIMSEMRDVLDGMDDNDPMRHTVRKMKRTAEQAVIDGLRLAQEIADATRQMRIDAKVSNVELTSPPTTAGATEK